MKIDQKVKRTKERRVDYRSKTTRNYRIEIKLIGELIYKFRVADVCPYVAGILLKEDSGSLSLIEVGQVIDAEFISPDGTEPVGNYQAEIVHIAKPVTGINERPFLVGFPTRIY